MALSLTLTTGRSLTESWLIFARRNRKPPARLRHPEHCLRHCLFSLGRNPAQQRPISKEATEVLDCRSVCSRCNHIADARKRQPAQQSWPVYTRLQRLSATE
jgi:hypothetical protein